VVQGVDSSDRCHEAVVLGHEWRQQVRAGVAVVADVTDAVVRRQREVLVDQLRQTRVVRSVAEVAVCGWYWCGEVVVVVATGRQCGCGCREFPPAHTLRRRVRLRHAVPTPVLVRCRLQHSASIDIHSPSLEHSNSRFESDSIRYANRFVYRLVKKSAFRFTSCHAVFLFIYCIVSARKISWRHCLRGV